MLDVLISPLARSDIKQIWYYSFKKWGMVQADIYTNAVGQAIDGLIENPEMGNSIDLIRKMYRCYHFKHHLIIYRVSSNVINVVRVLGESMDVERHL